MAAKVEAPPPPVAARASETKGRTAQPGSIWRSPWPEIVALEIGILALLGAIWVSVNVFDRLPHLEDDLAFLFQAQTIASGRLIAPAPPMPEFFWMPFVIVQDGEWFGKYPPGYPAALALGVLSGHPWLFNPVVGALATVLVYVAGRRLYDHATGLLAAALLAASPFFLLQAGSFLSHVACLFWATLFLLLFETTRRRRSPWLAPLAGAAIGMLFLSRPLTAVGIGAPFVIWALIDSLRQPGRLREYGLMAAGFLPFVAMMLGYNRMTTGDPLRFAYELWWPFDRAGFGEGFGRGGYHTLADGWFNTRYNLDALADYLHGWPARLSLIPLLVASAVAVLRLSWRGALAARTRVRRLERDSDRLPGGQPSREAWDLLLLGMLAGLIAVHLAYWTAGQMYGPRYYFEAMGAMTLLSARGILQPAAALGVALGALTRLRRPRLWTTAATLAVVAALVAHSFLNFAAEQFAHYTGWYDIDRDGLRVVERHDLDNALVFVEVERWTDFAPFATENRPSLDTPIVFAHDRGADNARLMALYPDRAYYRFADGDLTRLDSP